jgi:hypothetical protein
MQPPDTSSLAMPRFGRRPPIDDTPPLNGGADGLAVRLELHAPLSVLGVLDGIYIVIADMPLGARLSAGRCNSDFTWSLTPEEIADLCVVLPEAGVQEFTLTVRVVTPDPDGYEFASTTAQFNILVGPGGSVVPFNSIKRTEPREQGDWSFLVRSAYDRHLSQLSGTPGDAPAPRQQARRTPAAAADGETERDANAWAAAAEARQLAAHRLEWQADEAARLARTRARWEAEAEEIWRRRANELGRCYEERLAESETHWRLREAERIAAVDATWMARLAACEARWRADEAQRFAAAPVPTPHQRRTGRPRRGLDYCLAIGIAVVAFAFI